MDTDSNVNPTDRPHTVCPAEEMELPDLDQGLTSADIDQALSEEQTYRETMREALDSFMVWKHIVVEQFISKLLFFYINTNCE